MTDAPGPRIRPARADEYPRLIETWRGAVEATHAFLRPGDIESLAKTVGEYLPQMTEVLVAEGPAGTIDGFLARDGRQIEMLFVDPAVHGSGVGTRLLGALTARFDVLTVDVNEQNSSGRHFYRARGFEQVGRSELDGQGRPYPLLHLRLRTRRPPLETEPPRRQL
jgi:putative acetyltransferase